MGRLSVKRAKEKRCMSSQKESGVAFKESVFLNVKGNPREPNL